MYVYICVYVCFLIFKADLRGVIRAGVESVEVTFHMRGSGLLSRQLQLKKAT